jgi:hypothetical protein
LNFLSGRDASMALRHVSLTTEANCVPAVRLSQRGNRRLPPAESASRVP